MAGLLAQLVECGADNAKVMSSSLIQTNVLFMQTNFWNYLLDKTVSFFT